MNKERIRLAIARVRKAVAGGLAIALVGIARKYGVTIDIEAVQILVETAFISGVVYAIPNATEYVEDNNE